MNKVKAKIHKINVWLFFFYLVRLYIRSNPHHLLISTCSAFFTWAHILFGTLEPSEHGKADRLSSLKQE